MWEDCVSVKTCKKYQTVLEKIVKQFFARPLLFQQDEKNKNVIKLITNRWAWALVPTKLVEPGNALAWGGGIHGNPASSPHQAPSHWTIQWNTYRPNTYLAHTKREGGMGKTKEKTGTQTASYRPFSRWRHLTTTTRIHFVFAFLFKFVNAAEDYRTIALICTRKQQTKGFW